MPRWLQGTIGLALVAYLLLGAWYLPEWVMAVTIVAGLAWAGWYASRKRTKEAQGQAQALGLEFVGDGGYEAVGNFALLGYPATLAPSVSRVARGTRDGLLVTLFDHSTEHNDFTSVVLRVPGLLLPHFTVSPPSIKGPGSGSRIFRPRLSPPFEFAERPGFDRVYWATAEQATTREIFTAALLDRLERDPGWYLEGLGDRLLVAQTWLDTDERSMFLPADEVPRFLDDAIGFFALLAPRPGWTRDQG